MIYNIDIFQQKKEETNEPKNRVRDQGAYLKACQAVVEAADAVAACRYPPVGVRGFGPKHGIRYGDMAIDEYLENADREVLVIAQIEHAEAVENIAEILEVPGLDSICLGPNDLSGSFGKLG